MAATKTGRRHLPLTITEDMQDLWAWFQDVRPRAAAREVEFLLRRGVLHATGPWRLGTAISVWALNDPRAAGVRPQHPAEATRSWARRQRLKTARIRVEQAGGFGIPGRRWKPPLRVDRRQSRENLRAWKLKGA